MWQQNPGEKKSFNQAVEGASSFKLTGYNDCRLPNAKELQSIVDYTRCPQTTKSAALDPIFLITAIKDPSGNTNYPFFWTSTTHLDGPSNNHMRQAVYLAFGEAQGYMRTPKSNSKQLMNVHGAGTQRSDPKSGSPSKFKTGRGPQGDVVYIYNFARCVRSAK